MHRHSTLQLGDTAHTPSESAAPAVDMFLYHRAVAQCICMLKAALSVALLVTCCRTYSGDSVCACVHTSQFLNMWEGSVLSLNGSAVLSNDDDVPPSYCDATVLTAVTQLS